ncbi:MAG: hypothetical protein ACRCUP_05405 [Mycoplasmatales bacterium]
MDFSKLKLKTEKIVGFNLEEELTEQLKAIFEISPKVNAEEQLPVIAFAKTTNDIAVLNDQFDVLSDEFDQIIWVIYPKGTSKKYKGQVEINRNSFFQAFENLGITAVSNVAIDEDLSAIRFRFRKYSSKK